MHDWIICLALLVAALSSAAVGMVVNCCRRMKQEKTRSLLDAIHEQDRLARELEHARIEKQTLERVLVSKLSGEEPAVANDAEPAAENESN